MPFQYLVITSLHFLLGPKRGCSWGNHLNEATMAFYGLPYIQGVPATPTATFSIFSAAVSTSSHLILISAMVIQLDHCSWLEISRAICIHLWWNVFNIFRCFLRGIQHSMPYIRTDYTNAWNIFLSVRSWYSKTSFIKAPKVLDTWASSFPHKQPFSRST